MDLGIAGRTALVAGGSSGIGFAAARSLAREGCRVGIVSRSRERLDAAAERIERETGAKAGSFACDVRDPAAIRDLGSNVRAALGDPAILVTNAGGPPAGGFDGVGEAEWEEAIRLTLLSAVRLAREFLPAMRASRWGRIVHVASISVKEPIDGLILSNALRAGVAGFAKTLSVETARDGVLVTTVCPGYTDTERLDELVDKLAATGGKTREEIRAGWAAGTPVGRLGRPEEIGDVIAFLASERASFVTGVVLAVDGGRTRGLL